MSINNTISFMTFFDESPHVQNYLLRPHDA